MVWVADALQDAAQPGEYRVEEHPAGERDLSQAVAYTQRGRGGHHRVGHRAVEARRDHCRHCRADPGQHVGGRGQHVGGCGATTGAASSSRPPGLDVNAYLRPSTLA